MFIEKLTDNNKFEVGGVYSYAFACDSDSYDSIVVLSISATRKTCTIGDFYGDFEKLHDIRKKKITVCQGVETISAGNYSMAGMWHASERSTSQLRKDLDVQFMHDSERADDMNELPGMPEPINPEAVGYTAKVRFCDGDGHYVKVLDRVSLARVVGYATENAEQLGEILGGGWYIDSDIYENGKYLLDCWTRGNDPANIMAAVQCSYPEEYFEILMTCAAEILPDYVIEELNALEDDVKNSVTMQDIEDFRQEVQEAETPKIVMISNPNTDPEPPTDPTPTGKTANFSEFDSNFNVADVVAVSFGGVKNQIEPTAATKKRAEPPTAARSEGGANCSTAEPVKASEPSAPAPVATSATSPIDENAARRALESYSFSDYRKGSATAEYNARVLEVQQLAEDVKTRTPEEFHADIDRLVNKYAVKLATVTNDISRCQASVPSVMITGPANYPVRKHEKQMSRLRTLFGDLEAVEHIKDRIRGYVNRPIMSGDETAVERLTEKVEKLRAYQEQMKQENAEARKNGTAQPHPTWELSNNRQNLKTAEERLNTLKKAKEAPTAEAENLENKFCKVVRNSEIMRLQLFFNDKPSEEVRNILKSNGFKWAPSQSAWQRQLTHNAEYSFKHYVLPKLSELVQA